VKFIATSDKSKFYVKDFSEVLDRLDYNFYNPEFKEFTNLKSISKFDVFEIGDSTILNSMRGGTTPKKLPKETDSDEIKALFLKNENIKEGKLDLRNKYYILKEDYEKKMKNIQIKKGDILFSMTGTLGNACLIREEITASINQNIVIMRFNNDLVNNEYIVRFLNSKLIKKQIENIFTSALTPYLNMDKIKSLKIILPPKDLQKKIVMEIKKIDGDRVEIMKNLSRKREDFNRLMLDELNIKPISDKKYDYFSIDFEEIDSRLDSIWNNPKYRKIIKNLESNDLSNKFEEFINNLTNGIEVRNFVDDGTSYIRVGDIQDGMIRINEDTVKIKKKLEDVKKDIKLSDNDVILTRSGRVGDAAFVTPMSKEAIISSDLIKVRLNEKINPKYLVYYMNSSLGRVQIEMIVHGAASPKINQDNINNLIIVSPSLEKQKEIVSKADLDVKEIVKLKNEEFSLKKASDKIIIESVSKYGDF
jgi:type I restriction enzyme S subunit